MRVFSRKAIQPERLMALGFLMLIVIGGIVLSLPFSGANGQSLGIRSGFFTAASAVCVTGLSIIDAGTQLSVFGQVILLILIQLGGLGFMLFATLIMLALGRKLSLKSRLLLRDSLNQNTLGGAVRLALAVAAAALVIELSGAILLMIRLVPLYGAKGVWYSFFTSISAFCNAGFDLFGGQSLTHLSDEPLILLPLAMLILLGGLGFPVITDCLSHRFHLRSMSLHTKMVLVINGGLVLTGTLLIGLMEWRNPETLSALSVPDAAINSFFQSVTLRTAGFAAIPQEAITDAGKLLGIILMFIGASSASTGGGVKTTTVAMLVLLVVSVIRGREHIHVAGREIPRETAHRAMTIVFIGIAVVLFTSLVIGCIEQDCGMLDLLYETTSAFSTTGLSSAGTASLSPLSQWLLIPLMFLGRVGPLTLAFALASRVKAQNRVRYPEEKIMIG